MIEKLQHKFALSREGAVDMVKACISVTVTNIVLMASAGILYLLISDMLGEGLRIERIPVYVIGGVSVLILIYITNFIQYNATFLSTYKESGVRRTALAEQLRKLPLSFFGKKDLSDLTTTIMSDCAMIETASSHWIPELIGALISTAIVGVSMFFFFDWRMVLASFWVIPASFLLIWLSANAQIKAVRKNNGVKMELSDGIQECLESVRDLRANNAQDRYMSGLETKIRNVEKHALFTELKLAVFVNSAAIVLKLGIATTALVGGALFASGEITLLTFFMFLIEWCGLDTFLMRLNGSRIEYTKHGHPNGGWYYDLETGETGEAPELYSGMDNCVYESDLYIAKSYYNMKNGDSGDFSKLRITRKSDGLEKVFDFTGLIDPSKLPDYGPGSVPAYLWWGDWFITYVKGIQLIGINFETDETANIVLADQKSLGTYLCGDRYMSMYSNNGNYPYTLFGEVIFEIE